MPKIKTFIPGVATYDLSWDWSKLKPLHKQGMSKAKKESFIAEIEKLNQVPEKSTPAPSVYNTLNAFNKTSLAPRLGTLGQKQKEERLTFVAEAVGMANETPGYQYETAKAKNFVESRSPSLKMFKSPSRFISPEIIERTAAMPSPVSYNA